MNPDVGHPETIDPTWFQELVRRAWEREKVRLVTNGWDEMDAWIESMWYVFEIRSNMTKLYQAGRLLGEETC